MKIIDLTITDYIYYKRLTQFKQESEIKQQQQIMGIIYSIKQTIRSYFYPSNIVLTEAKIKTKSHQLIIRIKNLQYRLQQNSYKQESLLLAQIKQDKHIRSAQGEKVRMNMIIQNSQKRLVYDEVIYCLNKINAQAYVLENHISKISNQCLIAISSIIYVYNPLELKEYINLSQFIPEPFPSIDISNCRPLLQKYLKKEQISDYQRNLYAIQFANRNNISLQQINLAGHNFVSNPEKPIYQTPSAQMWAITLQELKVEEQVNA